MNEQKATQLAKQIKQKAPDYRVDTTILSDGSYVIMVLFKVGVAAIVTTIESEKQWQEFKQLRGLV